ncbi:MAG TPA: sugar ABC transporter substrate-binding protein, partial [Thermotoga sp.]|nr:sugar ABC transporter substrate-binding protein [Thermotoga sp.]
MRKFLLIALMLIAAVTFFSVKTITITAWTVGPDNPSFYRFENLKIAVERLNKILEDSGADIRIKLEGFFNTT